MNHLARKIFLATAVIINVAAVATPANAAGMYVKSKTFDADGELMSKTCENCWFWRCDC